MIDLKHALTLSRQGLIYLSFLSFGLLLYITSTTPYKKMCVLLDKSNAEGKEVAAWEK